MNVGAYYFDGWAGRHRLADDPNEKWARTAPDHLTRRMVEEFPHLEPVWGWRDDSLKAMERQIDLAADAGLAFFAFCWYWHDNGKSINRKAIRQDSKHSCLDLFLRAKNNHRLKFCLMVANHPGFEIKGAENWRKAAEFWMPYLKHPQHLTAGGKPLVIIYVHAPCNKTSLACMQRTARKAGLPGLAFAGCGGGTPGPEYSFSTDYNVIKGYQKGAERRKFRELVQDHERTWRGSKEQPHIPCIIAGWDCRPWETPGGLCSPYYPDRTPKAFAAHVHSAADWMRKNPDKTTPEQIAIIYAWNEFGEGGYLAPTKGDQDGKYLNALRSVVKPDR